MNIAMSTSFCVFGVLVKGGWWELELLDHRACTFVILKYVAKLPSKITITVYTLNTSIWEGASGNSWCSLSFFWPLGQQSGSWYLMVSISIDLTIEVEYLGMLIGNFCVFFLLSSFLFITFNPYSVVISDLILVATIYVHEIRRQYILVTASSFFLYVEICSLIIFRIDQ